MNTYITKGKTTEIRTHSGEIILLDTELCHKIKGHSWNSSRKHSNKYARSTFKKNGVWFTLFMHRILMDSPVGKSIDHINGDGLDNRISNLRIVTNSQNQKNRRKKIKMTSKYKGVCALGNKWLMQFFSDGKLRARKEFHNEIEAAKSYDEYAKKYNGEYACFNFGGK